MSIGKALIAAGVILVGLGILVTFGERLPIRFGRLPGDIVVRGKNSVLDLKLAPLMVLRCSRLYTISI